MIYPTQQMCLFGDDIIVLVKFWQMLHADKKYISSGIPNVNGELTGRISLELNGCVLWW